MKKQTMKSEKATAKKVTAKKVIIPTPILKDATKKVKIPNLLIQFLKPGARNAPSFLASIQRGIKTDHVNKLAKSMELMGFVGMIVLAEISFLTGKLTRYIVDGQHKYVAALRYGIKIPYVTIKVKDKKDLVEKIAYLNASSKSWTMNDYITAWSSLLPDYVFLNEMIQKYRIETRAIMACFMNVGDSSKATKILKQGLFVIDNRSAGIKLLDQINDCLKELPKGNSYTTRTFVNVILSIMKTPKYNHLVFLNYIKKNKKQLIFVTQNADVLKEFLNKAFKK